MARGVVLLALLGCAVHCQGTLIWGAGRGYVALRPAQHLALSLRGGSDVVGDPFKMNIRDLHKELKKLKLNTNGLKDELAKRLYDGIHGGTSSTGAQKRATPEDGGDEAMHGASKHAKFDNSRFTEDFAGSAPAQGGVIIGAGENTAPPSVAATIQCICQLCFASAKVQFKTQFRAWF